MMSVAWLIKESMLLKNVLCTIFIIPVLWYLRINTLKGYNTEEMAIIKKLADKTFIPS